MTAVQWFMQELKRCGYFDNLPSHITLPLITLEQAMKKEKEQIIEAHFEGWSDAWNDIYEGKIKQAEDYYNETYQNK